MIRRKIIMKFIVGINELGKNIYKKKTIKNIRPELSDNQLREFVANYCALTSNELVEASVVDERDLDSTDYEELIHEDEGVVIQEVGEMRPQDNDETTPEKIVTTALLEESQIVPPEGDEPALLKSEGIPTKEEAVLLPEVKTILTQGERHISLGKYGTIPIKDEETIGLEEREVDLGKVSFEEHADIPIKRSEIPQKQLVKPFQKKKMRPPVGKRSGSSKKKKRKL